MRTIFKYRLKLVGSQTIEMPHDAEFLSVQLQNEKICVWALIDTEKLIDLEYFVIQGTGLPFPDKPKYLQFLGTIQPNTGLVWHVFRAVK
jgi:hypothetical protein